VILQIVKVKFCVGWVDYEGINVPSPILVVYLVRLGYVNDFRVL
jgi:hypothetical protein